MISFLIAQNPDGGGLIGGVLSLMAIIWTFAALATIFWLWMLIDALTHEPTTNDKILWFLVIFFLHFVGALIYLVARRTDRSKAAPG